MNWVARERVNSGCWSSSLAFVLSLSLSQWSAFYQASDSALIYFHSYLVYLKASYFFSQIVANIRTIRRKPHGMKSLRNLLWLFVFPLASASWSEVGFVGISSDLFSFPVDRETSCSRKGAPS